MRLSRYLLITLLFFSLSIFQVSFLDVVFRGWSPYLVVVLVAVLALNRYFNLALICAFIGGLCLDLARLGMLGQSSLTLVVLVAVLALMGGVTVFSRLSIYLLFVVFAGLFRVSLLLASQSPVRGASFYGVGVELALFGVIFTFFSLITRNSRGRVHQYAFWKGF